MHIEIQSPMWRDCKSVGPSTSSKVQGQTVDLAKGRRDPTYAPLCPQSFLPKKGGNTQNSTLETGAGQVPPPVRHPPCRLASWEMHPVPSETSRSLAAKTHWAVTPGPSSPALVAVTCALSSTELSSSQMQGHRRIVASQGPGEKGIRVVAEYTTDACNSLPRGVRSWWVAQGHFRASQKGKTHSLTAAS